MFMMSTSLSLVDATGVVDATSPVTATLGDGLRSVVQELFVLCVFLATWSLTRFLLKRKEPAPEGKGKAIGKVKRRQSPNETAVQIIDLCAEQFTRGLRLYRELCKHDLDKEIEDEQFYTSLVEASVRVNKPDVAEQVVQRMHANGMVPSTDFLQSVLKLFAARKLYAECLRIWDLFGTVVPPHQVIYSCAAVAACETGDAALARQLLAEARSKFSISSREWLALMRYHVRMHDWRTAVKDLEELQALELPIDNIVFNTVLAACTTSAEALPTMHALLDAMLAYEKKHPDAPRTVDIVSYNTLMKALAKSGDVEGCFSLLEKFAPSDIEPDDVSFSTLLDVCIDEDEHQLASVALERMSAAGVQMNCVVMTTLMKGFVRSNRLDKAMQLYDSMRATNSQVKPDMITHSMLIKAHCDAHDMGTALKILEDMLESECSVDDVVFTHLIEGCCQVNNVKLAEKLFQDMKQANIKPSIYTLNGLVKVYGKCGMSDQAIALVQTMEETYGVKPTVVVFTCLVSGLLRQKKYAQAWSTFQSMRAQLPPDAQSTQTMLLGLADGQLWQPLLQLAEQSIQEHRPEHHRRHRGPANRPQGLVGCLNYGLNAMLNRSKVAQARQLYKLMLEKDLEVTVDRRRLNLP